MKYLFYFLFFYSSIALGQNYHYVLNSSQPQTEISLNRGYTVIGDEIDISDLAEMKNQNVNLIRWMLYHTWPWGDETDFEEYKEWLNSELDKLDLALEECNRLGIKVAIGLMDVPGERNPDGSQRLFNNMIYNDQYVLVWEQIAKRYNSNPILYGYGLMNEPVLSKNPIINHIKTQSKAAAAIRKIDTLTPLIFSSDAWNAPTPFFLDTVKFENVIYEVHMYQPHKYTHQFIKGFRYKYIIYLSRKNDCR